MMAKAITTKPDKEDKPMIRHVRQFSQLIAFYEKVTKATISI